MADQQKFPWVKSKEPKPDFYANYMHVSWTLFDVRFTLGQLVPAELGESKDFVIQEQGNVTVAWPEAKVLRDILIGLVESYEKTNGEIKPLKIAPSPERPTPSVAEAPTVAISQAPRRPTS